MKSPVLYRPFVHRIGLLLCVTILGSVQLSFKPVGEIRNSLLAQIGISDTGAENFVWGQLCSTGWHQIATGLEGDEERLSFIEDHFRTLRARSNSPEIVESYWQFREAHKPDFNSEQSMETRRVKQGELEWAIKAFQYQLKVTSKEEKFRIEQQVGLLKAELAALNSPDIEMRRWKEEYPESHLLVIRNTLIRLLQETENISFKAPVKNCRKGVRQFVNQELEGKPASWKTAFFLGEEATASQRLKATQWILEIESNNNLN